VAAFDAAGAIALLRLASGTAVLLAFGVGGFRVARAAGGSRTASEAKQPTPGMVFGRGEA
jgi:hypothetical protein